MACHRALCLMPSATCLPSPGPQPTRPLVSHPPTTVLHSCTATPARRTYMDAHDTYLVLTFAGETRVLGMNAGAWATTKHRMCVGCHLGCGQCLRCWARTRVRAQAVRALGYHLDWAAGVGARALPPPSAGPNLSSPTSDSPLPPPRTGPGPRAEDELDEAEVPGFASSALTLCCANTLHDQFLQVRGGAGAGWWVSGWLGG